MAALGGGQVQRAGGLILVHEEAVPPPLREAGLGPGRLRPPDRSAEDGPRRIVVRQARLAAAAAAVQDDRGRAWAPRLSNKSMA